MGLLTAGKSLFDKSKKKKDLISQTAILTMMEDSTSSREFIASMDEYLKNKNKQEISITEHLQVQKDRLNLSDSYVDSLPLDEGISQIGQLKSMIGAGVLALGEQAASAYIDFQVMKQRDISKQARFNRVKSGVNKTVGLAGSIFGGAVAGTVIGGPGVGSIAGGVIGGLIYAGKETISYFSNDKKEKFELAQNNKEAEINRLTLGDISSSGNRQIR